jgi:hypothetical protein
VKWLARALGLLVALHLAVFAYLIARRVAYPFDLEWMEGGMLLHAARLLHGQPLYGPPALEFVPFLYTPLYPLALAALAKLFGVRYVIGRVVSLAALGAALAVGYRAARRAGAARSLAAAAMAAVVAAFPFTGAWYDLVRADELALALAAAGITLVIGRPTVRAAAVAAALLCAGYWAKQNNLALIACAPVLLALGPRAGRAGRVAAYAAVVTAGAGWVAILNGHSDGWLWNWIARAHARHFFFTRRAFYDAPLDFARGLPAPLAALCALLVVAIARRTLTRAHAQWTLVAGAGLGMSCLSAGTAWAFTNARIPGVYFTLLALAALGATAAPPRGAALVAAALAVQLATHFYDPRPFCPSAADRAAGERLIARLRATPGDVFIPFHPFYGVLADKPTFLHRMGVLDSLAAGFGPPRGLAAALGRGAFGLVVMDDRMPQGPSLENWTALLAPRYALTARLAPGIDAPRVFSGAPTIPTYVYAPRSP